MTVHRAFAESIQIGFDKARGWHWLGRDVAGRRLPASRWRDERVKHPLTTRPGFDTLGIAAAVNSCRNFHAISAVSVTR